MAVMFICSSYVALFRAAALIRALGIFNIAGYNQDRMQQIYKYLSDPSWWFATVLVGILASLCASYIRDFFEFILSRVSSLYRRRIEAKKEKRRKIVYVLANESTMHLVIGVMLLWFTVMFVTLLLLYVILPVYIRMRYFPDAILSSEDSRRFNNVVSWVSSVAGLLGIYVGYFVGMLSRFFFKAALLRVNIMKRAVQTSEEDVGSGDA